MPKLLVTGHGVNRNNEGKQESAESQWDDHRGGAVLSSGTGTLQEGSDSLLCVKNIYDPVFDT